MRPDEFKVLRLSVPLVSRKNQTDNTESLVNFELLIADLQFAICILQSFSLTLLDERLHCLEIIRRVYAH
jgi:hypothetical protein